MGFEGKVAVVTGGASGIGRALCELLARRGAQVVVADRNAAGAEEVARSIGAPARAATLDVTDAAAFQRVVDDTVAREGRIDLLFNNAGIALGAEVRDLTLEHWRSFVEVNLMGVVHGVHAAYPHMIRQRSGHLVNTSSTAGLVPFPGGAPYGATKHAVLGLSTALRIEAKELGVRVSVVCPGFIDTAIFQSATYVGVDGEKLKEAIPVKLFPATRCAEAILRGVDRNRAIIPVQHAAWIAWWIWRLSPGLFFALADREFSRFRAARLSP